MTPSIPRYEINETCERCSLAATACIERAAHIYSRERAVVTRHAILDQLIMSLKTT